MSKGTIVLVPGLDGTALLFYRQTPILSRRFHVEAFPLPDDEACTMETLVAALKEAVDRVALERGEDRVLLCGESFGGALSLSFALRHPEKLSGMVILNSFPYIRQRVRIRLGPPLLKLMPWGAMPVVRRFTERHLHSSHTRREDLEEFHRRTGAIGRRGYIRRLELLRDFDVRGELHRIEVPTLFLAADQDQLLPSVAEARFMATRMPRATVRILEGYGHVCMINEDFDLLSHVDPWLGTTT
ncbi:MAG TPA: alpha/beta hydrolase [Vicinamibacteria bacterium]